ncbi:MAG TPA: FAD-dependent oxidoreductase [Planctomycetaceae bacterium]|nr:FAD-dependent oxidoreductase [Planctomycetaceae bacterium]
MKLSIVLCLPLGLFFATLRASSREYDLVVYGATSAGVVAAIQADRMGKDVIVVGPDRHLGGLTAGGLGWTDSGKKDAIGGISREFYEAVYDHYQTPNAWRWQDKDDFGGRNQSPPGEDGDKSSMWVFEPHVAERIFENFIDEHDIQVDRGEYLDRETGVQMANGRIQSIRMLSGKTYTGRVFIDATYEGDLMAAADVDYHVGREANSVYNEKWNGIQTGVLHHRHHFMSPIDPYLVPGDPSSGVLPLISVDTPGSKGDGDHRIQAYCYRMCLTNHEQNRIPFPKPSGYDPARYRLLLRVFATGRRELLNKFDPLPNFKTDTNNHGPVSTDYIGMNYDYPEASYERRDEIAKEHARYQQGLLYFMANDPDVPEDVRRTISKWGLAADEFVDNDHWPHQLYVREARRMVGHYVMTEHDCLDRKETPQSIAMGSYTLDSHNVQRYIKPDGYVQNEGDIGVKTPRPYEISYGSIVPRRDECQNLLVPVCLSASHIAYGSIRMEPVFMILGQSAATAACLAIDAESAVQDVKYSELRKQLLEDRQVLELEASYQHDSKKMKGIVLDDRHAVLDGNWTQSEANTPYVDSGYVHDGNSIDENKTAKFSSTVSAGNYQVGVAWPANANRCTDVQVSVSCGSKLWTFTIDQRKRATANGELFRDLATLPLTGRVEITITRGNKPGYVVVDAVRLLKSQ